MREERITNKYVRSSISVKSVVLTKIRRNRLRWLGYVLRREEIQAVRVVIKINVEEKK